MGANESVLQFISLDHIGIVNDRSKMGFVGRITDVWPEILWYEIDLTNINGIEWSDFKDNCKIGISKFLEGKAEIRFVLECYAMNLTTCFRGDSFPYKEYVLIPTEKSEFRLYPDCFNILDYDCPEDVYLYIESEVDDNLNILKPISNLVIRPMHDDVYHELFFHNDS